MKAQFFLLQFILCLILVIAARHTSYQRNAKNSLDYRGGLKCTELPIHFLAVLIRPNQRKETRSNAFTGELNLDAECSHACAARDFIQRGWQNKPPYLGSEISKAYYFPWITSIHLEIGGTTELIGSGSIIAPRWMVGSLDCFIKRSKVNKISYYQQLKDVYLYSGDVWSTPFGRSSSWLQRRRIVKMYIFSDPDIGNAQVLAFEPYRQPVNLFQLRRSPFGLRMSMLLIRVVHPPYMEGDGKWEWKRGTLPIPLFSGRSSAISAKLNNIVKDLEKYPFQSTCYVAGWRKGDGRLIQYQVMYVPLQQCQSVYCAFNSSACGKWPVQGIHACFKSLTYTDLCWTDQGSALYCEAFAKSVLAVLTSAPTCGFEGLPGVYTLMTVAARLFEIVSPHEPYRPITDLSKY